MDRFALFRIFTAVVDSGSFTRAAERTGLSRSSVSAAIRELEDRVGARLLARTTRRVALTQEGAVFREHCGRVLEQVEEAENLFRPAQAPAGRLRVDMPGRIGRLIVAPRLPEFLDRYPDLDIRLGVTDRAINLAEEGADCVLRVGQMPDSGLAMRALGELPLINVASADYVARHGMPADIDDLDRHRFVHYASPSSDRIDPFEWVAEDGAVRTRDGAGRVTVDGAEAYIACCLAGLGIIQIPAYDVHGHIAAGELVEVLPGYRPAPMPVALVFPSRRYLPQRTRVFADWLADVVRDAADLPGGVTP